MKEFILNEKEYCENLLKSNEETKHPGHDLVLLAQYYYQIVGYRKSKITKLLLQWLANHYPPFQHKKEEWAETCESIARKTGGKTLLEIEGVSITESELETIGRINDKQLERLLFVMLCVAKYNLAKTEKMGGWVNLDIKDIFTAARIGGTNEAKAKKIHSLVALGLLETPKKVDKVNCRVNFIDSNSPQALFVSDFRELGYEYEAYKGRKIFKCTQCGRLERYTEGNNGLCKACIKAQNAPKMRTAECVDCGKSFTVDARVANKCRCDKCQDRRNKEKKIAWKMAHCSR